MFPYWKFEIYFLDFSNLAVLSDYSTSVVFLFLFRYKGICIADFCFHTGISVVSSVLPALSLVVLKCDNVGIQFLCDYSNNLFQDLNNFYMVTGHTFTLDKVSTILISNIYKCYGRR